MIGGTMLLIVQLQRHVWLFTTLWTGASHASLSLNISQSLLKPFFRIPSNHLILCCPLLLLPSIFANIRVFPNELSVHIRWPKYWSFSSNNSPSSVYSGLISFKTDWFDHLAVQETFKSLLQHRSSKASILWHSALFMVQIGQPYVTAGKTITLTIQTFVIKRWVCFLTSCLGLSSKDEFAF